MKNKIVIWICAVMLLIEFGVLAVVLLDIDLPVNENNSGKPLTPVEDLEYELIDGGVRITGYHGTYADVVIPARIHGQKVIAIGEGAFRGCGMNTLHIPKYVKVLEKEAFADCALLSEVTIPRGLKRIESRAFANCVCLGQLLLPAGLEYLAMDAVERDK